MSFGPRGWLPWPSNPLTMVRLSRVVRTPSTGEGSCGARAASDLEPGTGGGGPVQAAPFGPRNFSR